MPYAVRQTLPHLSTQNDGCNLDTKSPLNGGVLFVWNIHLGIEATLLYPLAYRKHEGLTMSFF